MACKVTVLHIISPLFTRLLLSRICSGYLPLTHSLLL
nr:MAG TPA: hypothetical protein [Caudoviricetes sp.]